MKKLIIAFVVILVLALTAGFVFAWDAPDPPDKPIAPIGWDAPDPPDKPVMLGWDAPDPPDRAKTV